MEKRPTVPFKKMEAWNTLFGGLTVPDIIKELNTIWLQPHHYRIELIERPPSDPNQLNILYDEPIVEKEY